MTVDPGFWELLLTQPLRVSVMRRTAPLMAGARPHTLTAGSVLLGFAELDVSALLNPPRYYHHLFMLLFIAKLAVKRTCMRERERERERES